MEVEIKKCIDKQNFFFGPGYRFPAGSAQASGSLGCSQLDNFEGQVARRLPAHENFGGHFEGRQLHHALHQVEDVSRRGLTDDIAGGGG